MSGFNEVSTSFGRRSEPVAKPKSYFPQTIKPSRVTYYDAADAVYVVSGSGPISFEFQSGSGYVHFGDNNSTLTQKYDINPTAWSGSSAQDGMVLFYYKGQSG